ncbi:MAG: hypothetical protein SGI88_03650 [Candidatus Hydrogenedentes bacterium]|nr:hypothetical protein [Candidatus Hydrogenedentota bacterium]
MTRAYLELGASPSDEKCAQVGDANYRENAVKECQAYIQAIRNVCGPEPEGARLSYRSFPHDFGPYYEAVCYYDEDNQAAVDYAFMCDEKAPPTWEDGKVAAPVLESGRQR